MKYSDMILILAADGMMGHKAFQVLNSRFNTYVSFHDASSGWLNHPLYHSFPRSQMLHNIDALDFESVESELKQLKPDVIINCIGVVKQRAQAKSVIPSIRINSLFPHQLADLCESMGTRLIHVSTDCIFSGGRGSYTEEDLPDPVDIYGRTKLLGEVGGSGCVTLRTSIVGWELKYRAGLLEWFAAQRHRSIQGYRRAIYTGVSTTTLAGLIGDIVTKWPDLNGILHVASEPISKYELLSKLRDALGWFDIGIEPDDEFCCDRSLISTCFEEITGWQSPSWDEMIAGLAEEWPMYEEWRKQTK